MNRMRRALPLLIAVLAPALAGAAAAAPALQEPGSGQRSVAELVDAIRAAGDGVDAELFEALARHRDEEALAGLIEALGRIQNQDKHCAAYRSLRHFAGAPGLGAEAAEYLAEQARGRQAKRSVHAAWRLGALWPASRPALVALALEHPASDRRSLALMHLVRNGMPLSDKELGRFARHEDPMVRYEGVLARAAAVGPERREGTLLKLARSKDVANRLAAVELLATTEHSRRFELLRQGLEDKQPPVQRKALASLERSRARPALEILVAALEAATPGEAHRVSAALRRLTGLSFGPQAEPWMRWWREEGGSFRRPESPTGAASAGPAEPSETAARFYGLAIHADRLVFAVDTSDSMKQPAGRYGQQTRLEVAQEELREAVRGLPKSSEFDLVNFGKSAWSWRGELVEGKRRTKERALERIDGLRMSWGTEVYQALRASFRDPRADTILLLTDGDPQLSLLQDRNAMRQLVVQWNRTRHTTVDCLTIGTDRPWLRKLAEATGGRYRRIE